MIVDDITRSCLNFAGARTTSIGKLRGGLAERRFDATQSSPFVDSFLPERAQHEPDHRGYAQGGPGVTPATAPGCRRAQPDSGSALSVSNILIASTSVH